jgi:hypothetical protein
LFYHYFPCSGHTREQVEAMGKGFIHVPYNDTTHLSPCLIFRRSRSWPTAKSFLTNLHACTLTLFGMVSLQSTNQPLCSSQFIEEHGLSVLRPWHWYMTQGFGGNRSRNPIIFPSNIQCSSECKMHLLQTKWCN